MGGEYNASTGIAVTNYYIEVSKRHFDKALELISCVITKPVFNEEEINKERNVILSELKLYSDYAFENTDKIIRSELFKGNIISKGIVGEEENIMRITKDMLEEHYKKYYCANNIVVTILGDVEDPTQKIEKYFNLESRDVPKPKKFVQNNVFPKIITTQGNTNATYVELAFLTTNFKNNDNETLGVIEELLESGKTLSLMEEIRYRFGLTYHVNIYNHGLEDTGLFAICLSMEKDKTQDLIDLIKKQLQKIQEVNKTEVEKAKKRLVITLKRIIKCPISKSQIISSAELNNYWEMYEEHIPKIKAVTTEQVKEVAKKYLEKNYVQAIVLQKENK